MRCLPGQAQEPVGQPEEVQRGLGPVAGVPQERVQERAAALAVEAQESQAAGVER